MIGVGGDALIDFVPGISADGEDAFVPRVGGSCLNVAVACARLGAPTAFLGGLSNDMFGASIAAHMAASAVDLSHAPRSDHGTTLAFVRLTNGDAEYAFFDEGSASRMYSHKASEVPELECLHYGSTSLINEPAASAYEALMEAVRDRSVISFDPNCRPTLVPDKGIYRERMDRLAARAHVVRFSGEDFEYLYGSQEREAQVVEDLLGDGVRVVLLSRGGDGATAYHAGGRIDRPGKSVEVVDTIGAGDTFHGSFLVALRNAGVLSVGALGDLDEAILGEAVDFAISAAAINVTRAGANPPSAAEMGL